MNWDDVNSAFKQAKSEMQKADQIADSMAQLLIGRLQAQVGTYTLQKLKRELRDFNIHTCRWRKRG